MNPNLKIKTRSGKTIGIPAGAYAAIVAETIENRSDSQTDYFGSTSRRCILIGWRYTARESFAALRKAAAAYYPAAHLATKEAEHRENYSMGGGNYLKAGSRHADGIRVKSVEWSCEVDAVAAHVVPTLAPVALEAPAPDAAAMGRLLAMPARVIG